MSITYTVLPSQAAVLVKAEGVVDLRQFIDHLAAMIDDPAVPADHVTLIDASRTTELRLTEEDIVAISTFTAGHPDRIIARKLAIVTCKSSDSDLAYRYEQLASHFREKTIVFFNIDAARLWLGLPLDREGQPGALPVPLD